MKDTIKIVIIQMEIMSDMLKPEVLDRNDKKALQLAEKAAQLKPDLIVFPDDFTGGYGYGPLNIPRQFQIPLLDKLKIIAHQYKVHIAGALLGRIETIVAKSFGFLINTDGYLIGRPERLNIYKQETDYVCPGEEIEVFDSELGKIGFAINIDLLIPEITQALAKKGAEIILSPSFFYKAAEPVALSSYPHCFFQTAALARAMENQVYVVLANGVGREALTQAPVMGGSLIANPVGMAAQASDQEELFVYTLTRLNPDNNKDLDSFNLNNIRESGLYK